MTSRVRNLITEEEIERLKKALEEGAFELSRVIERSAYNPPKLTYPVRRLVFSLAREGHPYFIEWLREKHRCKVYTYEELEVLNANRAR